MVPLQAFTIRKIHGVQAHEAWGITVKQTSLEPAILTYPNVTPIASYLDVHASILRIHHEANFSMNFLTSRPRNTVLNLTTGNGEMTMAKTHSTCPNDTIQVLATFRLRQLGFREELLARMAADTFIDHLDFVAMSKARRSSGTNHGNERQCDIDLQNCDETDL